jgi:hypothetical protein
VTMSCDSWASEEAVVASTSATRLLNATIQASAQSAYRSAPAAWQSSNRF